MAKQQHKAIQTQGRRAPSPAKVATNTYGTYGGVSSSYSGGTRDGWGDRYDDEEIVVPPAVPKDNGEIGKIPLTVNHLMAGWKYVVAVIFALGVGLWWVSHLSSKVDQHDEDIKEVKAKTDKLEKDSVSETTTLNKLDSQVGRLEDKVFELSRSKK
ncbi:MAG: hypothetical protein C0406_08330 [Sideroxydans sp.]|nr:hypothetical protein [Sideroxydans sp.]